MLRKRDPVYLDLRDGLLTTIRGETYFTFRTELRTRFNYYNNPLKDVIEMLFKEAYDQT